MDCRWVTFTCVWLACCQSWKLPRGNCPTWRPYLATLQKLVEPDHTQIEQNCSPQCSPSARSGESSANRDSSNGIVNLLLISKGFSWEYWCGILLLRQVHLELDSLRVVRNDFFCVRGKQWVGAAWRQFFQYYIAAKHSSWGAIRVKAWLKSEAEKDLQR